MCDDNIVVRAVTNTDGLLNDPLVRMVMHADGATPEDMLAALQIAYRAVATNDLGLRAPSARQCDLYGSKR
jgi:hypothetical protein